MSVHSIDLAAFEADERLDAAVRRFVAANYPTDKGMWLRNRARWGMVSPLDMKAIREAYKDTGHG